MRRTRLVAAAILALVPLAASGQAPALPKPTRLADTLMVQLLNDAEMRVLDSLPGASHEFSLRLFTLPVAGDCLPEGDLMICSYHYFLAVSEVGEMPSQAVYDLGTVGELTDIKWIRSTDRSRAHLRVTVMNLPAWLLKKRPELHAGQAQYTIDVSADSISIKRTQ